MSWDDPPAQVRVLAPEQVRTVPVIRGEPLMPASLTDPDAFRPTDKQVRFLNTVTACVGIESYTFPTWRVAHMQRCDEKLTNAEWSEWNASPAFVKWFTDDLTWTPTASDEAMMETHFQTAMSRKLKEGKDTKALEMHAKITKKIGDNSDQSGGGMTDLLKWAHGAGAASTPARKVVEGKAVSGSITDDPWGAARVVKV
jgi:hypothetical protein